MIIWSGRGLNVIAAVLVSGIVVTLIESSLTGTMHRMESDGSFGAVLMLAGMMCWIMGHRWAKAPERVLIDQKTGEAFEYQRRDTLFFMSMKSWGVILILVGTVFALHGWLGGGESWMKDIGTSPPR